MEEKMNPLKELFKKKHPDGTPFSDEEILAAKKAKAAKKAQERDDLSAEEKDLERREAIYKATQLEAKAHDKEEHQAPPDAFLSCRHVNKIYSNRVQAVYDFNLDIKEKEFIVLVGPSGCGKSTTLRMIAGLEDLTSGDLFIDGMWANKLEPKQRGVAMVFQSYALYPHMSVYDNMAFGLSGLEKEEIDRRIAKAAKILQIEDYLKRKPTELSGGQCQRVALGRAIVRNAKVFLLDEPLSNLDAKLRVQMRSELVKLHGELQNTMIYVTHDQTEAMTMADRIVVMKAGKIQQIGTPREVYDKPANVFVATFIGSPTMNVFDALYEDGKIAVGGMEFMISDEEKKTHDEYYRERIREEKKGVAALEKEPKIIRKGKKEIAEAKTERDLETLKEDLKRDEEIYKSKAHSLYFGIRPEDIAMAGHKDDEPMTAPFLAKIEVAELLGSEYFIHFPFAQKDAIAKVQALHALGAGGNGSFSFRLQKIHLFDKETKKIIF